MRLNDGREEDLLHHHRLHALLCRSGGAPDPGQPQSEFPDTHLDLGSPWHCLILKTKDKKTSDNFLKTAVTVLHSFCNAAE